MDFSPFASFKKRSSEGRGGPVWRGGPGDIVVKLASDGSLLEVSSSASEIIGPAGNLVGRSLFDFVRREDRAAVRAALDNAASPDPFKNKDLRADFRLLRLRKAPANAEITFLPIHRGCIKALIRDRTGELQKLREARAASEQELASEWRRADVMADLGHELKTPLNAIMGFAETMEAEAFGPLGNDRYKEYASLIRTSGGHLLDLIAALLDNAKLDAGRYEISPALENPGPMVRDCAEMVRGEAEKAGLKLIVNIDPDLPEAMLDARAVKQILINLLSNAVKFTASGEIELSVSESCGAYDFVVRDTGIGMNQVALAKLGGRFTEIHQNGVRGSTGAGLGLSLAFSLAKLHGGVLRLTSTPGEGTSAKLTLPIRKNRAEFSAHQKGEGNLADIQSQLDRVDDFRQRRARKASAA